MKQAPTFFHLLGWVLAACLAIYLVYLSYRPGPPIPGGNTTVQVDSVKTQVDTTSATDPEPSETRPHDTVKIYIRVPVPVTTVPVANDSVPASNISVPASQDSTFIEVALPIEQKVYEDSTYRAVISGYRPNLDSISVYNRNITVYQTKTVYVEPSRWNIGLQAGYGASKDGLTPYIGIGITYTLFRPKKNRRRNYMYETGPNRDAPP